MHVCVSSDAGGISRERLVLLVVRKLERFADRVTNMCERIVFMVKGRIEGVNVSKY